MKSDGARGGQEVEPLTNYFVGRATKDCLGGNLVLGIATSVVRRLATTALRNRLTPTPRRSGRPRLQWDKKNYRLFASAMLSNVAGDSAAMLRMQRASARYFQRPDRDGRDAWFDGSFFNGSIARARRACAASRRTCAWRRTAAT